MGSKSLFFVIVAVLVLATGYVGYRLFGLGGPSPVSVVSKDTSASKSNSNMRFSNSVTGSVWNDPRLKEMQLGQSNLKTSAEVENNLKILTALYDQGSDIDFLKRLKELIAQNPNVKEYAALLGDFYYNEGNWSEAENAVKRLIELDPQNNFAKTSLAEILAVQGRYDDGQHINEQVLEVDPRNVDAMYGLMSITDMQGRGDAGIKYVEELYRKDPANGNAAAVLADSLYARNNPTEAYKIAVDGLKQDPNNALLLRTGAKLAARQGNYGQTIEWAEASADKTTDTAQQIESLHLAWQASLEKRDPDRAEKNLRRILEIDRDNEIAHQGLEAVNAFRSTNKGG
jgi:tetratricopeptide (TPR) repeat protein